MPELPSVPSSASHVLIAKIGTYTWRKLSGCPHYVLDFAWNYVNHVDTVKCLNTLDRP